MKELCIPIPGIRAQEVADIRVTIAGQTVQYNFRVESFPWEVGSEFGTLSDPIERSLARIYRLKSSIDAYDRDWELIQIFNPEDQGNFVHVLYRQKLKP